MRLNINSSQINQLIEYSYTINESSKSFDVVVSGEVDSASFTKLGIKMRILALELGYTILFDYKNAKVNISVGEIYFWFRDHLDIVDLRFRSIPTAHLTNETEEHLFKFMDLAWTNAGIIVKTFKNHSEAEEWLRNLNKRNNIRYEQVKII